MWFVGIKKTQYFFQGSNGFVLYAWYSLFADFHLDLETSCTISPSEDKILFVSCSFVVVLFTVSP